jgi:hypothetical protein
MTTANTCASCRFYGRPDSKTDVWDPEADGGDGEWVTGPHRKCLRIIHGNGSERATKEWPALIRDGSGYVATMWTLPTFSCALWEAASSSAKGEQFTCPECGSHMFGTSNCNAPDRAAMVGHCHGTEKVLGRSCRFTWKRSDDAQYFKAPK